IAASAMIVTWNCAERFALCAFAASRRTKKNKRVISHPGNRLYRKSGRLDKPCHREPFDFAQGRLRRGGTAQRYESLFNGIFRLRLAPLKMTKRQSQDRCSPAVRRDRSAHFRQSA